MKKGKITLRRAADVALTTLIIFLMCYATFGELFHELAGLLAGTLAIEHSVSHGWHKTFLKGRYGARRSFSELLLLATLSAVILQTVSGIVLSRRLFTFLPLEDFSETARRAHLLTGYWLFILAGIHVGEKLRFPFRNRSAASSRTMTLLVPVILFFGYGVYSFISLRFYNYLFMQTEFAFFDAGKPVWLVFSGYVAVFFVCCTIGVVIATKLQRKNVRGDAYDATSK